MIVPSVRCVMVYVEGTKKAMRHFTKLMMHRINWNERVSEKEGENNDAIPNGCTLLWQVVERCSVENRERSSSSRS